MSKINPEHYNKYDPAPWDVIEKWGSTYNIGSALKYLCRYRDKGDAVGDLQKAIKFIEREIQQIQREDEPLFTAGCKTAIALEDIPVNAVVCRLEGKLAEMNRKLSHKIAVIAYCEGKCDCSICKEDSNED